MTIQPYRNKLQLKIESPTAGGLDLSSKATIIELGEVVAIGELVENTKVGDKIMFRDYDSIPLQHEFATINKNLVRMQRRDVLGLLKTY